MKGGRRQRMMRSPGSSTDRPNGYVTRSTVCPSVVSARMRWYSENGVPRGSKNGSGAIIKMCMRGGPHVRAGARGYMLHYAALSASHSGRHAILWIVKIGVSGGL